MNCSLKHPPNKYIEIELSSQLASEFHKFAERCMNITWKLLFLSANTKKMSESEKCSPSSKLNKLTGTEKPFH